jgi:hypothetical protein
MAFGFGCAAADASATIACVPPVDSERLRVMAILIAFALSLPGGCAGPPASGPPSSDPSPSGQPPAPTPSPTIDGARRQILRTYLAPDVRDRSDRRAWLARLGEVRLTPDGPAIIAGTGAPASPEQLLVVEEGPRIGVVVGDMARIRMFVYVDLTDLAAVVGRETKLSQSASRSEPGDLGVYMRAGARVTIAEIRGAEGRVVDPCQNFDAEGWLPGDALARVFSRPPEVEGEGDDTYILSGSVMTLSPGGPPVAEFHDFDPSGFFYSAVRIGKPRRGYQRVEFLAEDCRARGWVATANLSDKGSDVWGGLTQTQQALPCATSAERVPLVPGVVLVHADSRLPFAVVNEPTELFRTAGDRLCLPTFWGPVEVTALAAPEPRRVAGGAESEASRHD